MVKTVDVKNGIKGAAIGVAKQVPVVGNAVEFCDEIRNEIWRGNVDQNLDYLNNNQAEITNNVANVFNVVVNKNEELRQQMEGLKKQNLVCMKALCYLANKDRDLAKILSKNRIKER